MGNSFWTRFQHKGGKTATLIAEIVKSQMMRDDKDSFSSAGGGGKRLLHFLWSHSQDCCWFTHLISVPVSFSATPHLCFSEWKNCMPAVWHFSLCVLFRDLQPNGYMQRSIPMYIALTAKKKPTLLFTLHHCSSRLCVELVSKFSVDKSATNRTIIAFTFVLSLAVSPPPGSIWWTLRMHEDMFRDVS